MRRLIAVVTVMAGALFGVVIVGAAPASAVAVPVAAPSDPRAQFVPGNATTCAQVGVSGAIRLGAPGPNPGADAFVEAGIREERYVDVVITPAGAAAGVVIDAIVVKGGDGYNLYSDPAVLPPALGSPQGYMSPFVGTANVPRISHWFVCYHFDELPTGTLLVNKDVLPPDGIPVEELPVFFSAVVTCDTPGFVPVVIRFGGAGGVSPSPESVLVTGLTIGAMCTVTELETPGFPPGTAVSYVPSQSVTISEVAGVEVAVVNDFSGVAVQTGSFRAVKEVRTTLPPSETPQSFVIEYACTDGTAGEVSLPGSGGSSEPIPVSAGAICAIAESAATIPPGWTVSYTGGDLVADQGALFTGGTTESVITVINTAPAAPLPPEVAPPAEGEAAEPSLAESGAQTPVAALSASLALLALGALLRRARLVPLNSLEGRRGDDRGTLSR